MPISIPSISNSTPPQTHLREVILDDSLPATDRLAELYGFLNDAHPDKAVEGIGLYATHKNGETTFYLATDAVDSHRLVGDEDFPVPAARAYLALQELSNILHACVKDMIVDSPPWNYGDELNDPEAESCDRFNEATNTIKDKYRDLLNNAIDNTTGIAIDNMTETTDATDATDATWMTWTTDTTGTDDFAPPEAPYEQGQGQTGGVFSPPPDILDSYTASRIVGLVKDFASEFQDVDKVAELFAKQIEAPVFPDTENTEIGQMVLPNDTGELFPVLKIGKNAFTPEDLLEQDGSSSQLLLYRCEETGETKLVKLAILPDDEADHDSFLYGQLRDAKAELSAGKKYAVGEHNVLGYTDHVELDNGTVALIGDDVGRDDVRSFGEKLNLVIQRGLIGPDEREIVSKTLTQDLIRGAAWLEKNGTYHGDMKPENQIIDADGVAHLVLPSFNEGAPLAMRHSLHLKSDSYYNAPEVERLKQKENPENHGPNKIPRIQNRRIETLLKDLKGLVSPENRDIVLETEEETREHFVLAAKMLGKGPYGIDSRADVFALGVTLTELMTGDSPDKLREERQRPRALAESKNNKKVAENSEMYEVISPEAMVKVNMSKPDAALDPTMPGVSSGGTVGYIDPIGNPSIDELLGRMLTPNPNNRIGPQEVLEQLSMSHRAPNGFEAVGSPQVRKLIKAIMDLDAVMIEDARDKLRAASSDAPPPPPSGPGA